MRADRQTGIAFLLLVIFVFGLCGMASSQTPYGVEVEPRSSHSSSGTANQYPVTATGATRGGPDGALTSVISSVAISQRYDSNIMNSQVPVADYVTNISPTAALNYAYDWIDGTASVGLTSEVYARNPGLNYVGTNGSISAGLDNLLGRIFKGGTFQVMDAFMYTPKLPAFASPETGNQISPEFVRGIQAYRTNSFSNSLALQGGYGFTPRVSAIAGYSYSILKFLSDSNAQASNARTIGALFDTTTQSINAGPQYQLSPSDKFSLLYQHQKISFGSSSQGIAPQLANTSINGASLTWSSDLTRYLTVVLSPGVSVIEGFADPVFTAVVQGQWRSYPTSASFSYTRGVYPSFFIQSAVLVSDLIAGSFTHLLTGKLSIGGEINYSTNRSVGGGNVASASRFSSTGYSAGVSANYNLSPTLTIRASASYSQFNYVGDTVFDLARQDAMLMLRKEWR